MFRLRGPEAASGYGVGRERVHACNGRCDGQAQPCMARRRPLRVPWRRQSPACACGRWPALPRPRLPGRWASRPPPPHSAPPQAAPCEDQEQIYTYMRLSAGNRLALKPMHRPQQCHKHQRRPMETIRLSTDMASLVILKACSRAALVSLAPMQHSITSNRHSAEIQVAGKARVRSSA